MRTVDQMRTKLHSNSAFNPAARRYFSMLPVVLCLALLWPFSSAGKKIHLTSSQVVPAAHGALHVKVAKNGNTKVDIEVHALANPSALTPPEQTYVVWFQASGQNPVNEGALRVDSKLNGQLTTVTPYKDFKVFITAEKYAQVHQPSGMTVLSADVAE